MKSVRAQRKYKSQKIYQTFSFSYGFYWAFSTFLLPKLPACELFHQICCIGVTEQAAETAI